MKSVIDDATNRRKAFSREVHPLTNTQDSISTMATDLLNVFVVFAVLNIDVFTSGFTFV